MNWNAVSKLLTIGLTIVAAMMAFDWSVFGFTPEQMGGFLAGLGAVKLTLSAIRDGLVGMFAEKPSAKDE